MPGLSDVLEGAFRQGQFRGVTTVVLKLLNIVLPDVAFVGRKDYQQQLLIRKMVADLDVPVEIMTCPTVREADGLALSSRNTFLSPAERETALAISRSLERARQMVENEKSSVALARSELQKRLTETAGLSLDYATIVDAATLEEDDEATCSAVDLVALVAARVGATRLIDNLPLCRSRSDH